MTLKRIKPVIIHHAKIAATPAIWDANNLTPPPKRRPLPVVPGQKTSCANNPTAIVPHAPQTPCTEIAPTGSSICKVLSIKTTAHTTRIPATIPIITALPAETNAQPAVIPTRPARAPFKAILISGFLNIPQAVNIAAIDAADAANVVVMAICAISVTAPIVLPGLKPYQPNHNRKTPRDAKTRLCPGMALDEPSLLYLPSLGPRTIAPVKAIHAPVEWTTVDPAKSHMPIPASHPPPHIQCPTIG